MESSIQCRETITAIDTKKVKGMSESGISDSLSPLPEPDEEQNPNFCWWCKYGCGNDDFQKGSQALMRHCMEGMSYANMMIEMGTYRWRISERCLGAPPAEYAQSFRTHFEHIYNDEVLRYRMKVKLWDEMMYTHAHMYTQDEDGGTGEPMKGAAGSFFNSTSNLRQIVKGAGVSGTFNT